MKYIETKLTYEIGNLSAALTKYAELSDKSEGEIIVKKTRDLQIRLSQALRALTPAKGSILSSRIEAMRNGGGIKIRPAIYIEIYKRYGVVGQVATGRNWLEVRRGKRKRVVAMATTIDGKNVQALAAERELKAREGGRGFMAYSTPKLQGGFESGTLPKIGRYQQLLSELNIDVRPDSPLKFSRFMWRPDSPALEGLSASQQYGALIGAVQAVTADVEEYINRKLGENKEAANL